MGRKIPGKKHRGIKDPLKQRAQRLHELESKINAPPKDINQQALPRSLERLIQLKEKVKAEKGGKIVKKRRKNKNALICVGKNSHTKPSHPKAKPEKAVPIFEQRPGESSVRFLHRVSRETQAFINETSFEKKYNVQVKRNPETGKVEGITKPPKDALEEKLKMMHQNIKKKKKKGQGKKEGQTLTKSQKRKLKLQMKRTKREENEDYDEFTRFNDKVKFGEVVHSPPQLTVKPKVNKALKVHWPMKKSLLLHSLIENNGPPKMNKFNVTTVDNKTRKLTKMIP